MSRFFLSPDYEDELRRIAIRDYDSAMGVKLRGRAVRISDTAEAMAARNALLTRIPSIEPFFKNPNILFYRLVPEKRYLINFAWGVDWRVEVV